MVKVAFCDDDLSVLNEIKDLLEQYLVKRSQKITYAAFCNPLDLMTEIEKGERFDALFLDVIMPGQDGIRVAEEIRQYDTAVKMSFLTSSAEFAVQSYTVGAYFYQMKPIGEQSFYNLLDTIIEEYQREWQYSLVLRCKSGTTRIDLDRLEYCEVMGRTLLFHMKNKTVLESSGRLDELCSQLAECENFLRPHRSFLVNMEYIQNISCKAITMDSLAQIPIPHGKCSEIKNTYLKYAFNRKRVFLS